MHGWRCRLGKWMTSAHPLGGIDGLIIVGHLENRWISDAILSPYKTVQNNCIFRYETTTASMAHEESVRVKTLCFRGLNDNQL